MNAQITINQQITVKGFEGADRTGTVISMNGGMSFLGQFVTIRLDTPFMQKNALNISKTISLRVVPEGNDWKQRPFGK
jgi:hypothetical protein